MTHTPGPWHPHVSEQNNVVSVRTSDGSIVAQMWEPNAEDHARLIAAAPDLDAYRQYVEDNLDRIEETGGWTPICFAEFLRSEELVEYRKPEPA